MNWLLIITTVYYTSSMEYRISSVNYIKSFETKKYVKLLVKLM